MKEETKRKISESCKKRYTIYPKKKSSRKIYWIEGDKIFDSAKEAALFFDSLLLMFIKRLKDKIRVFAATTFLLLINSICK